MTDSPISWYTRSIALMNTQTPRAIYSRLIALARRSPRKTIFVMSGGLLLALAIVGLLKTAAPLHLQYQAANQAVAKPFTLRLGQYIKGVNLDQITISPAVAGSWQLRRGGIITPDQLVFTPHSFFAVNTTYRVTLPSIDRYVLGERSVPPVQFSTEAAPALLDSGLGGLADGATIAADTAFVANFSAPNNGLRHLILRSDPALDFTAASDQDMTFRWKPTTLLPQGTTLSIELFDDKNAESLLRRSLKIADEPTVTSPTSRDHMGQHDSLSLTFSQPIDPASNKLISIDTEGSGTWKSPTEYVFTPKSLEAGRTYHYTVKSGLRSQAGGILTTDQTGSFATTGAVRVVSAAPRGSGLAQHRQVVSFTFDQPVDHASAQARFSISSGTITGFTWQGNTMQATVSDLGFQRTITMRVEAGVANAGFGLPSNDFYTHSFTTEVRSVRLAVPSYRQQHSGTCAAASLRMALGYRGIGSDEMGLVGAMGYAPRDIDRSTDPPTWDDPSQMFVGSVDGSIAAGTGAGPDAAPIAKAARAYGRSAQNFTGADPGWIAEQLYAGNPVLMFGSFRATGTTSWRTPSGGTAIMNLTGHVTVVVGVQGEPSAPLGFWVNDPLVGSTQYWSASSVAANIARDPYRQAVVVY